MAGILAAGSAPAFAQGAPEVKWRLTSSFPEEPRHHLRRRRGDRQARGRGTNGKFQIQVFAAGEIVPGLQVVDAVQNGTVAVRPHRALLLRRQGPDVRLRHRRALRHELPPVQRLVVRGRRRGDLINEFFKDYGIHAFLCGNTGAQMGGWYRKEIKTVADLKGLKMRIGGFAGQVLAQAGRRAAADRRRRDLPRAREGHHRRGRVGRPLRRREARLQQGRQVLLLPRLVGRRPGAAPVREPEGAGTSCPRTTRRSSRPRATRATR